MIKDGNYITIQGWMITRLHLAGNELIAYAVIYGFSQNRESVYDGSVDFMSEWLDGNNGQHACDDTTRKVLNSLVEKGFVGRQERVGKTTLYWCIPLANCYPSKSSTPLKVRTPENQSESPLNSPLLPQYDSITPTTLLNIPPKKNELVGSELYYADDTHTYMRDTSADADHPTLSFDYWWNLYSHGQFMDERKKCERKWGEYTEPIKKKIIEHSTWYAIDNFQKPTTRQKHPWWYLYDEIWQGNKPVQSVSALNGTEADMAKREGKEVWQCKLPDGKFGFMLLEDANKMKLEKLWRL